MRNPYDFSGQAAWGYARVSTDDQAERGYSVPDQRELFASWASRNGATLGRIYADDESAKVGRRLGESFERRPEWSRLMADLRALRPAERPAFVLVKDWSRFGRDTASALALITFDLRGLGVEIQSCASPINWADPHAAWQVVIPLLQAETENRQRSDNVRRGMRAAMRAGRHVSAPPKGYRRGLDADGRYLIVPGLDADHVRNAFALASDAGRSMESIRLELRKRGFRCSKNQMTLLLRNALYAGRIVVPAHGDDAERVVAGVHEPLVDGALFDRVQSERFGVVDARSRARRRLVEELPLRGHLLCPRTGARLTGSRSRSSAGGHVWYYHGQGAGAWRVRADAAHGAFAAYLSAVRLAPAVADLLRAMAEERGVAGRAVRARAQTQARTTLEETEAKLLTVDTRWLDGEMDRETHERLSRHYRDTRDAARLALAEAAESDAEGPVHLRFAAEVLERLPAVWEGAEVEARDVLARSIWPSGLVFDGEGYRTAGDDDLIGLLVGVRAETRAGRPALEGDRPARWA